MCIRDRYFIASDESESDCLVDDGPAYYCIGSDSEAEDYEGPVDEQGSSGQSVDSGESTGAEDA
eukprot:6331871-Alexandrium_andersonii.AAC.1